MAESKGSAPGSLYTRLGELQAMTPTDAVIAQYCEDSFPHVALENLTRSVLRRGPQRRR